MASTPHPSLPRFPDHDPDHDHDDDDELHRGLQYDVGQVLGRRRALTLLAGAGMVTVAAACGSSSTTTSAASSTTSTASGSSSSTTTTRSTTASTAGTSSSSGVNAVNATTNGTGTACAKTPEETEGPYPADGSNGPNVLTQSGIVRRDITSSFGASSGTAKGLPLEVTFRILDYAKGCAPMAGAAVYAWHCDRDGLYSLYSQGATDQNYLRGVQVAGDDGRLTFTTIFPGAYSGRWPHIHFEVYATLDKATAAGAKLLTSQIALPADTCNAAYATTGYETSVRNMKQTSLARDMVFSDGVSLQLPTVTGDATKGYAIELPVPV